MKTKLQLAIDNNHGIYEIVFDSWNIPWEKTETVWYSLKKAPPLNSNLVTRSPMWKPDEVFQKVDDACVREGWKGWSIKDSFQSLDLSEKGFTKLFDAQWLYLEAKAFAPARVASPSRYVIVKSPEQFLKWKEVWNKNNDLSADTIYLDSLLTHPDIFFVIGEDEAGNAETVCILNITDGCIGVSNFYAQKENIVSAWSGAMQFIQDEWGASDIVGYERADLLQAIKVLGVEPVGDLSIWIKENN